MQWTCEDSPSFKSKQIKWHAFDHKQFSQKNTPPAQWFASQCSSAPPQLTSLNLHLWALFLQIEHFNLSRVARQPWLLSYPFSQLRILRKLGGQLTCCLVQVRQIIRQLLHSNICNRAKYYHRSLKTSWKKNICRKAKSDKTGFIPKEKWHRWNPQLLHKVISEQKILKNVFKKFFQKSVQ